MFFARCGVPAVGHGRNRARVARACAALHAVLDPVCAGARTRTLSVPCVRRAPLLARFIGLFICRGRGTSRTGGRGDDAFDMLLPDETYEQNARAAGHLLAILRVYDDFLARHRIRPEFFCRYRLHNNPYLPPAQL